MAVHPFFYPVVCALAFGVAAYLCRGSLRGRSALCVAALGALPAFAMAGQTGNLATNYQQGSSSSMSEAAAAGTGHETAVFGAGCFWCVEPAFEMLKGVVSAESGYMGGTVANPTYEQICTGKTGHAEVVKVVFDPNVISYGELVDWFFQLHDPTTLNRQGADVGTQYRSVIFTYGERQQAEALAGKARAASLYADPIVTFVEPAQAYYKAEGYHQDYYRNNPSQPYCRAVIAPKLQKLQKQRQAD